MAPPVKITNPRFVLGAAKPAQFPDWPRLEIAFGGRSNVGKSSLLRTLLGSRRLVRVSRTPGRTQEVNFFSLELDGMQSGFVDLPGYGFAKVPGRLKALWGRTVERYVTDRDLLVGFVLLMDARREPSAEEQTLIAALTERGRPCLPVYTKADKLPRTRLQHALLAHHKALGLNGAPLAFSAKTGEGREDVLRRIRAVLRRAQPEPLSSEEMD